jgi:RNA polymerase sigma-70 factor (ECF subfamily)
VAPDDHARAAQREALVRAFAALSDAERELVMLTHWDGLTPRAAARVLGLNAAQARTRLYRARRTLRTELAGTLDRSSPTATPRSAHDPA